LKNGKGEEHFSNGDKYNGEYKDGKQNGLGRYEWSDGSYYEG
jgi:1-phosphatidylinositol-4-phosphate 5-kinase